MNNTTEDIKNINTKLSRILFEYKVSQTSLYKKIIENVDGTENFGVSYSAINQIVNGKKVNALVFTYYRIRIALKDLTNRDFTFDEIIEWESLKDFIL